MTPLKKHFVTGLVVLLPLVITIAFIIFLVNFLTEPFMGIASSQLSKIHFINHGFLFLSPQQLLLYTSKISILLLLFLFTLGLGILTRLVLMNVFLKIGDKILHRIPLINTVYKTTQDIIKTLFASDKNTLKQVVMVPFPRKEVYVLGLIARESPEICCTAAQEELISVFIPTTPNPTTGFLLMIKRAEVIFIDMKTEDAIKYIVSCGVIIPENKNPNKAAS